MDQTIKQQIVIAAAQLAGKGASNNAVLEEAKRIAALAAPGSFIMNSLDYEVERVAEAPASKPFTGTLLHVDVELSSSRGVIFLATSQGIESIRTDFTRNNPQVQAMVRELSELVGHRLSVRKRNEAWKNDPKKNTKVLVAFEDKGLDQEAVAVPNFGMDWAAWAQTPNANPLREGLQLASKNVVLPVKGRA